MPVWLKRGALVTGALGLVGLLLMIVPTAALGADGATQEVKVTLLQAILIGLGYYLAQSPWLFGLGFFTIYRPLAAGFFVGLIMGDPAQGTLIGAAINVAYLGFVSAGGSLPGDIALAGWLGTALALAANLNYSQALALAVPIGLLGTIIWYSRMTVDALFAHWADYYAERGNIRLTGWMNVIPGQIFLFLISFIPCTIAAYSGTQAAADLINALPIWVLHGLTIGGGIFAAVGIAMNMRFIFRGAVIPYFFIGYFVMVATGKSLSIVVLAVLGLALAFLHVTFTTALKPAAERAAAEAPKAAPDRGLRVTRGDLIKSWILWTFFSHANYNYERLQATAFAQAMTPIVSRLYTTPDEIKAALKRHLVFFNTEPNWGGVIHGIVIAMEEERANGATNIDDDAINSVKTGMMGPLAGIGDTIDQGTILPILLAMGIGIAGVSVTAAGTDPTLGTGNALGAIFFMVAISVIMLPVTYIAYTQGYYRGRGFVTDLLKSGVMDRIVTGATVLGNIVLGALTAQFVTLFFAPTIKVGGTSLNIQTDILDKLLPGLNPLVLVLLSWWLLRRRVSPILLLVIFIVVAIIGAYPFFGPEPKYFTDACGSALFQPYGPCAPAK